MFVFVSKYVNKTQNKAAHKAYLPNRAGEQDGNLCDDWQPGAELF